MNYIGWYSLYQKEIMRFLSVYIQSFLTPVITAFLFLSVTEISLTRANIIVGEYSFTTFLVPGLCSMSMAMTAFSNPSFSILLSKLQRNFSSVLLAPLSAFEFYSAYVLSATTRGLLTGLIVWVSLSLFTELIVHNILQLIIGAFLGSLMLSHLGYIAGLWSNRFEHLSAVMTFGITPLSLLSGGFYLQKQLPTNLQAVSDFNPFFYFIDLVRSGMLGISEASLIITLLVLLGTNVILSCICYYLTKRGYNIKE